MEPAAQPPSTEHSSNPAAEKAAEAQTAANSSVPPSEQTKAVATAWWRELIAAAKYLTRLRIPLRGSADQSMIARSMVWFPVIGACIGLFGSLIESTAAFAMLPSTITATLAVAAMMWLTRGLHEEEMASLANQYGNWGDKSRRVGWLKEERSIPYGTIAVLVTVLLKIFAIASLNSSSLVFITLIASGAWSHALMSAGTAFLKPLPEDPVSEHFGQPPATRVLLAIALGIVIVFAALGLDALPVLIVSSLGAMAVILLGSQLFRGYNGPLLGGLQQVVELTTICTIVATQ